MTVEQVDRSVVSQGPIVADQPTIQTDTRRTTRSGPGGSEMTRRVVVLIFGLIELVIGLRIVLLVLDARTGNALVSGILNISQVFVGPFDGILHTNALSGWRVGARPRRGRGLRGLGDHRARRHLGCGHLPARTRLTPTA